MISLGEEVDKKFGSSVLRRSGQWSLVGQEGSQGSPVFNIHELAEHILPVKQQSQLMIVS